MNETELKQRTKKFALRVIKLVGALPKSIEGRALANQLIRSGTSVGANYRAACRGRSKAEFISKLGTVEEEADESAFWMELIIESGLLKPKRVEKLLQEANETRSDNGRFPQIGLALMFPQSKIKNQKSKIPRFGRD